MVRIDDGRRRLLVQAEDRKTGPADATMPARLLQPGFVLPADIRPLAT